MLLAGCSSAEESNSQVSIATATAGNEGVLADGVGEVTYRDLTVRVEESAPVRIEQAELEEDAILPLLWLVERGLYLSIPVHIVSDSFDDAPVGGRLEQRLSEPLPDGWDAGFLTFDETTERWIRADAQISDDRTSLAVDVEHFSSWLHFLSPAEIGETMRVGWQSTVRSTSDFTRAAGQSAVRAAEHADYVIGGLLSTRVDAPTCSSQSPSWVSSTVFIEFHKNNPIHFCAGSAPSDPELLEIKVRVNRGSSVTVSTSAEPFSGVNTTFAGAADVLGGIVGDAGGSLARLLGPSIAGDSYLGAGQELTLVFDETAVRDAPSGALVTVNPPSAATFLVEQIATALVGGGMGAAGELDSTATAVAIWSVAQCQQNLAGADSSDRIFDEAAKCAFAALSASSETIARVTAGQINRALLTRVSLLTGIIAAGYNGVNAGLMAGMHDGGRTVTVFATVQQRSANGAAACESGTVISGSVEFTHPGWGRSTFMTCEPETFPGAAGAAVIDSDGVVRWRHRIDDMFFEYRVASPGTDASGNLFVIYNPGRYDGVSVMRPTTDSIEIRYGFEVYGDTWTGGVPRSDPLSLGGYHAELIGPGQDGLYQIEQFHNDCTPGCANGTTTSRVYAWNGSDYAPR